MLKVTREVVLFCFKRKIKEDKERKQKSWVENIHEKAEQPKNFQSNPADTSDVGAGPGCLVVFVILVQWVSTGGNFNPSHFTQGTCFIVTTGRGERDNTGIYWVKASNAAKPYNTQDNSSQPRMIWSTTISGDNTEKSHFNCFG